MMITEYSNITGISAGSILGRDRNSGLVAARHLYWYILRRSGYTLIEIGKINRCNHASIHHGIHSVTEKLEVKDQLITNLYEKTKHLITQRMSKLLRMIELELPHPFSPNPQSDTILSDIMPCPRCGGKGIVYVGSYPDDGVEKDPTCPICHGSGKMRAHINIKWEAVI